MTTKALLVLIWLKLCQSEPCIPANTCFDHQGGNDKPRDDKSWLYRCDSSGTVYKDVYMGTTTCEGDPDGGASGTITLNGATGSNAGTLDDEGDEVAGSTSGAYSTDYLQGLNCPLLNSDSDACTDYFIVKHRGDRGNEQIWEGNLVGRPYLDIGDNCTAYETDPTNFTLYDSIFLPYGCVNQGLGSNGIGSKLFECSDSGWSWTHYNDSDCTGKIYTAQSESFVVNKCGYFHEWTHCLDPTITSGCVDDGQSVLDWWWYWYDLVCCPNTGTPCVPGSESTLSTDSPTASPSTNTAVTDTPTTSGTQPTASPSSTGAQPTTAAPTSAGTAEPTEPTTAAPTDSSGTSRPTEPTTAAPTSTGTARPTSPTSQIIPTYGAPSPTTSAPTTTGSASVKSVSKCIIFSILCVMGIIGL